MTIGTGVDLSGGGSDDVIVAWNETDLSQWLSGATPEFSTGPAQTLSANVAPFGDQFNDGYPYLEIDQAAGFGTAVWVLDPAQIPGGALPQRYQIRLRMEVNVGGTGPQGGAYFLVGNGGSGQGSQGVGITHYATINNVQPLRLDDGTLKQMGGTPAFAQVGFPNPGMIVEYDINLEQGSPVLPYAQMKGWSSVTAANRIHNLIPDEWNWSSDPPPASWNTFVPVTAGLCAIRNGGVGNQQVRISQFAVLKHPFDRS
jgi:hypothetical protein